MATIGLTFFLEGLAQTLFGADVYPLNIGLPKEPLFVLESLFDGGILVNELDIWAAVIAGLLVAGLAIFFQRTRIGRALRAVADDHAAAQSVGIPLNQIWFIVWLVAGWWRWSPALCGAASSACSSRSPCWRSRRCPS
jgi:branched-chain amino acid transport system permease protein